MIEVTLIITAVIYRDYIWQAASRFELIFSSSQAKTFAF